jgi:excisionase family DNA binding protein
MQTVNGNTRESGQQGGTEMDGCFLEGIYARPTMARELGRKERVAAFSQLMFVAGPIMAAMIEIGGDRNDGLKTEDFELADELWTVKELAAKLRVSTRTIYAGVKSGKYPFAIVDGRNIRISRLGFQRWQKNHAKKISSVSPA